MKKKDIKKGDYIYERWDSGREFINLITSHSEEISIWMEIGKSFTTNGKSIISGERVRYATSEEISWLDACIKANKYIPFKEINIEPQYEIY